MGAFGTAILENDTSVDYFMNYHILLGLRLEKSYIRELLIKNNQYLNDDDEFFEHCIDDYTEFWTAIAFAEWFYSSVSDEVMSKVERIVNTKPESGCWDEPEERLKDVIAFFNEIKLPRQSFEKELHKVWKWENTSNIIDSNYSYRIRWDYECLTRCKAKNAMEILLEKYAPLTQDFEDAIFWATIGCVEVDSHQIQETTISNLERILKNDQAFRVFKVAYGNKKVEMLKKSVVEIKNELAEKL